MFRTRDFVLFCVTIAFLVIAIGATIFSQQHSSQRSSPVVFVEQTNQENQVEIAVKPEVSRAERLQSMREKIAQSSQLSISNPEPEASMPDEAATSSEDLTESNKTLLTCADYRPYAAQWSPAGIIIEEVEGARLVYRTVPATSLPEAMAQATGTVVLQAPTKEILLQLPLRSFPLSTQSCIYSDVIGIANDGSLIRNSEAGLYGIFSSNTMIGYALDGFPIYGAGDSVSDACGGVMGAAGYQYQISLERDTILNCFSAPPVRL